MVFSFCKYPSIHKLLGYKLLIKIITFVYIWEQTVRRFLDGKGRLTVRCCKELVKYVKCLLVAMQLPNSKWGPFLKIKIFMSAKKKKKKKKILEK